MWELVVHQWHLNLIQIFQHYYNLQDTFNTKLLILFSTIITIILVLINNKKVLKITNNNYKNSLCIFVQYIYIRSFKTLILFYFQIY